MVQQQNELIAALYQENYPQLLHYAENSLNDINWAQDVVHDVFYEALNQANKLSVHENPRGWLMTTLQNKITDNNRMYLRYIRRFLSLDPEVLEETLAYEPDMSADSVAEILRKVKEALDEAEFHLLRRLVLEQRSHAQVAQELNISQWTCQKRLERIRRKLYTVFPERKKRKLNRPKIF